MHRTTGLVLITLAGAASAAIGTACSKQDAGGAGTTNAGGGTTTGVVSDGCTEDSDCDSGDACDPESGMCVPSGPADSVAVGGDCVDDAECETGDACDDTGHCVADSYTSGTEGVGDGCLEDADCEAGETCDLVTDRCVGVDMGSGGGSTSSSSASSSSSSSSGTGGGSGCSLPGTPDIATLISPSMGGPNAWLNIAVGGLGMSDNHISLNGVDVPILGILPPEFMGGASTVLGRVPVGAMAEVGTLGVSNCKGLSPTVPFTTLTFPAADITSVMPTTGLAKGMTLTLMGSGFTGTTDVVLQTANQTETLDYSTSFTIVSDTVLTVVLDVWVAGTYQVEVTNMGGMANAYPITVAGP